LNEVAILQSMTYRHIIQILDFFEEKDYFFMVMDYMRGGDVFDRIVEKNQYTEKDARDLSRTLLKAVSFLHQQGVAHRDLKPQNLLLSVSLKITVEFNEI
jgi:calcium/calmodulin-dependent protein kinase I